MALNRIADASLEDTTIAAVAEFAVANGITYDTALGNMVRAGLASLSTAPVTDTAPATAQ